jgi:hypothetical protein
MSLAVGETDPVVAFTRSVWFSFDALTSLAGRFMEVMPIATPIAAK